MNADQLIKLIDAGFTKEDIMSLAHSASPSNQAENVPEQSQPSAPEAAPPQEEPKNEKQDISEIVQQKLNEVFEPFKALYDNMAKMAGMPSMQDVQPKGIEDIITDFFKGE